MISYSVYKIVHLVGILMIFLSLGGVTMHVINGGGRNHSWRRNTAITHGVGLALALVGGFGLLARLGMAHNGLPGWIIAKLIIWVIMGGLISLIIRKKALARPLWVVTLILGGMAAYLAGFKPF